MDDPKLAVAHVDGKKIFTASTITITNATIALIKKSY